MTGARALSTLAALVLLGSLAACGGSSSKPTAAAASSTATSAPVVASTTVPLTTAPPTTAHATTAPTSPTSSAATPATSAASSASIPPLTPADDEAQTLVTIIEAVNPGISTDKTTLVADSTAVCQRILAGQPSAQIIPAIQQQFKNGSFIPKPAEAKAIEAAITATFCR
jgi:hypothetical protein